MKSKKVLFNRVSSNIVVIFVLTFSGLTLIAGAFCFHSLILAIFGILLFITMCFFSLISFRNEKKEIANEILTRHEELIGLVQKTANTYIRNLKAEDDGYSFFVSNDFSLDWVIPYNDELVSYIEDYGFQKTNSFVESTFLIKSLFENDCAVSDFENMNTLANEIQQRILFDINIEIAFQVGFKMISRPYFYQKIKNDKWIKVKPEHEKVIINVPHGLFQNNSLLNQIIWSIHTDYSEGQPISIKQLSNMLHLLYLYNKNCQKT